MEVLAACFRVHNLQTKYFSKWAASVEERGLTRKAATQFSRLEAILQVVTSADSQIKAQVVALRLENDNFKF